MIREILAWFRPKPRVPVIALVGHTKGCNGDCGGTYQCIECRRVVGNCEGGDDAMPEHCTECWWKEYQHHEKEHRVVVCENCPFCEEDSE